MARRNGSKTAGGIALLALATACTYGRYGTDLVENDRGSGGSSLAGFGGVGGHAANPGGQAAVGGGADQTGGRAAMGGVSTGGQRGSLGGTSGSGGDRAKTGGTGGDGSASAPKGGAHSSGGRDSSGGNHPTGGTPPGGGGGTAHDHGGAGAGEAAAGGAPPWRYTVIDLAEAANNAIELVDGEGYWYTLHDGGGTIVPDTQGGAEQLVATELPEARGTSLLGMHVVANNGFDSWGAGLGFDLNAPNSNTKNKYDASRYSGLVFWARSGDGTLNMRVKIVTAEVVEDSQPGGECSADCDDVYGVDITLGETWQEYSVALAAPPLEQVGWGASTEFNPESVISVQFQAGAGVAFDVWIDDIRFFTE